MSTMRAVLIKDGKGKADALYIGEAPKPSAGPGQIVVKIKAFGLNRMDILQREGNYPGKFWMDYMCPGCVRKKCR
jgi:NADPH:quinone reductase-like Zn-dependent oxidoreductase